MIDLHVNGVHKHFGGLHALKGVTFRVEGAELIGLIGPNGAGKTTLTNVLDGAIKPSSGTVYLNGARIDHLPPYLVAKAGIGRTFQVTRAFRRMTVLENLYVPALAMNPGKSGPARHRRVDRLLQHRETARGARRADAGRGIPGRDACGHDGQAASRLAHIPTGATAATGRSMQGDSGGLNFNRNTP